MSQRAVTAVALLAGGAMLFGLLTGGNEDVTETDTAVNGRGYYLNDATLTTALRGLERWLDKGEPPTTEGMQRLCRETATVPADCRFLP